MLPKNDIERFVEAQRNPWTGYEQALREVRNGCKTSHWIWYIFPQFREFAHSSTANYYGIDSVEEARQYLEHPVLGARIREISEALLAHEGRSAYEIFGSIDERKVRSSMTMFDYLAPNDVFARVLDAFYGGVRGGKTMAVLTRSEVEIIKCIKT